MVVCDTHVLIFDALMPRQLSAEARRAVDSADQSGELACADISLWEIAMLAAKGRLQVDRPAHGLLDDILTARRIAVLPITPAIADIAASDIVPQGDPADRLIAATALAHRARLVSKNWRLRRISGLTTIW
jgi:PIN domain nuclease of toxin-antitoxin system